MWLVTTNRCCAHDSAVAAAAAEAGGERTTSGGDASIACGACGACFSFSSFSLSAEDGSTDCGTAAASAAARGTAAADTDAAPAMGDVVETATNLTTINLPPAPDVLQSVVAVVAALVVLRTATGGSGRRLFSSTRPRRSSCSASAWRARRT